MLKKLLKKHSQILVIDDVVSILTGEEEIRHKLKNQDAASRFSEESEHDDKRLRFGSAQAQEADGDETVSEDNTDVKEKEVRVEFLSCPVECQTFLRIEEFARILVDGIIEEAQARRKSYMKLECEKVVEGIQYAESDESVSDDRSIESSVRVFEWPTIDKFTVEIGILKINEYVSFWKFKEQWKFCIKFLEGDSDAASDFYRYEVIFSIPCKEYPIPQATASVYFTIEVSRVKTATCYTDVYYCFEGQRYRHTPGKFTSHEQVLFNIVDAKIKFYKTLTF